MFVKIILIISSFLIISCNANEILVDPLKPEFEISFDVVQKQLVIKKELPDHIQLLISQWFDHRINIDGFDGDMKFTISDFKQDISSIDDEKSRCIFVF